METYGQFLDRISSFEKKETDFGNGYVGTNTSLTLKVDENNQFKDFYGDTVVFNLDHTTKEKVHQYVERVFECAPECFCERLVPHTYHVTLHDLSNSPELWHISDEVFRNEIKLIECLKAKKVQPQTIRMKTKVVFNMVHTSLVFGLYPADETEYQKLMELYEMINEVKQLNYPLTPHITMAYYNRYGFSAESARKLETVIKELNEKESFEIVLDTKYLYYQKFTSMNNYIDIFCVENV